LIKFNLVLNWDMINIYRKMVITTIYEAWHIDLIRHWHITTGKNLKNLIKHNNTCRTRLKSSEVLVLFTQQRFEAAIHKG
jgi:hypothetical protein